MTVVSLDHVNVICADLAASAEFYASVLGLEERDGPGMRAGQARWLCDARGQAIVHLNAIDMPRRFDRDIADARDTGTIHHVALRCTDRDDMLARLAARGCDYQINRIDSIGLTQVFVFAPDRVLLELNFPDDLN